MDFLNTFGVSWPLFVAQVINFLVLYFILSKFLFKPIIEVLEKRQKKIQDGLDLSDRAQKIIDEAEAKQEVMLQKAQAQFDTILKDATKKAEGIIAEAETRARKSADDILLDAKAKIDEERQDMRRELQGEVANLVAKGLAHISRDLFDSQKDKAYIAQKLEEYKESN